MNRHEAKVILEVYRPSGADALDPQFAEALELARRDPELRQWLADQQAFDAAVSASLAAVPVPPDLKASLLAQRTPGKSAVLHRSHRWWAAVESFLRTPISPERKILASPLWRHWYARSAVIASVIVLVTALSLWLARKPETFARYRAEVVEESWDTARHLGLATSDLSQIRGWLARQNADTDFGLPTGLATAHVQGCRVLDWRGRKVVFLCLFDGPKHLHLFVAGRENFADVPRPDTPQFEKCERWQTASWSEGNNTYILSGMKYTAFVKKFRKGGQWLFAGEKVSLWSGPGQG